MKRFRFGLEKVLELRQHREEEAKNELGKAIGILANIENKIKINNENRNEAARKRFEGIGASGNDGFQTMILWDSYIRRLEQEAEGLEEQAARAELLVEEKRKLYLEASRELKVLEKLKEKRQKEYRKEMFAVEAGEMEDMWRGNK